MSDPTLAKLVQEFFLKRLQQQRNASPHTIASYRDTLRLLLQYVSDQTHRSPSSLSLQDLDSPRILGFLNHLESARKNSIRSRNARLAAVHSFFRYCSYHLPEALSTIQGVMAIPRKRSDHAEVEYLSAEEMQAILSAVDLSTWSGMRDQVMFATLYNTGTRVSEITALRILDVSFGRTATVRILGKGRKERMMPLWKSTAELLQSWIKRLGADTGNPLFPNSNGNPMTRHGVEYRLQLTKTKAEACFPSLKEKHVSPHTIRHTTAMHLLQSGVDITVIALWLGHESPTTTHLYLKADLAMKEQTLERLTPPHTSNLRFKATDALLGFLENL